MFPRDPILDSGMNKTSQHARRLKPSLSQPIKTRYSLKTTFVFSATNHNAQFELLVETQGEQKCLQKGN